MKIVHRYILAAFLRNVTLLFLVLLTVLVVSTLWAAQRKFPHVFSLGFTGYLFASNVCMLQALVPLSLFLGEILTLNGLSSSGEYDILRSTGASLWTVLCPILPVFVVFGVIMGIFTFNVFPLANHASRSFRRLAYGKEEVLLEAMKVRPYLLPGFAFHYRAYRGRSAEGIRIVRFTEDRPRGMYTADRASLSIAPDTRAVSILLERGAWFEFHGDPPRAEERLVFGRMAVEVPTGHLVNLSRRHPKFMTHGELSAWEGRLQYQHDMTGNAYVKKVLLQVRAKRAQMWLDAVALAVFFLVGVPIGLLVRFRNVYLSLLPGVGYALFVHVPVSKLASSLHANGTIPLFIAVLLPVGAGASVAFLVWAWGRAR